VFYATMNDAGPVETAPNTKLIIGGPHGPISAPTDLLLPQQVGRGQCSSAPSHAKTGHHPLPSRGVIRPHPNVDGRNGHDSDAADFDAFRSVRCPSRAL
jgi:hypothetical protein